MTRALLIAAPASGQGKTLTTAALAWHYRQQGYQVRVFKAGPDFLDPMILAEASGHSVGNLDQFMGGIEDCLHQISYAAQSADLILVEGVMGLYDGTPSSADLAVLLNLPILLVIDATAMAQTFGALTLGLCRYNPQTTIAGILANRVSGPRHAHLLQESLPPDLRWWGSLPREPKCALPERHLGLFQPSEIGDLKTRLTLAAQALPDSLKSLLELPVYSAPHLATDRNTPSLLQDVRIGIAQDAAFSFIYPANLRTLTDLGAELCFFSPLSGDDLPVCDALWLPGGYPELHIEKLSRQSQLHDSIRQHYASGKPIWAECGGMVYLAEQLLHPREEKAANMVGLIPGTVMVHSRLQSLGLQKLDTPWGELRGHTFHYSSLDTPLEATHHATSQRGETGEFIYHQGNLMASYLHSYFPSNPLATAHIFRGSWA